MKIPAVFVAVILTTLKDASSSCYRDNLPPLRCISNHVAYPGPVCAPPSCSNIISTHKNHQCPSTIVPDRLCSHNPIFIPDPCCDMPRSRPAHRPVCVKKEIVNQITVSNCCSSEDEVCPRFNHLIPNSAKQCHYNCEEGRIITHSSKSKAHIKKVAVQNVIVKNVHGNDRCGSDHIAPPLCSSSVSNVGPHYPCAERPLVHGCGSKAPINKVTVQNVVVKNIPKNDYCHCEQPSPPLCAPCISNLAPRLHCTVPPVITRERGCKPPIKKVTVKNVIVKNIPVNNCRQPTTSCISNPIPHCHFPEQPVITQGFSEPPINYAMRNVFAKNIPKYDCSVQHPPPKCSNIIVRPHQRPACVSNTCPERCCSPEPTTFIPDPPCKAPVRTVIVQPNFCCQRDPGCNINPKYCCENPCVQCDHCCKQNCCNRKHNCDHCCSKCNLKKCQPPCYKDRCCEDDPFCCKAPVRTVITQPNSCCQKDRCRNLNSKSCCDNPCFSCDNYCDQNWCYKKDCCEQCCSNICCNKCQQSSSKCNFCESDPCCGNKKCSKSFICKCYPCSSCEKKCTSCCKKVKCCDSCCSKSYCCQNSKPCKSNCNFTPVTFTEPHRPCFESCTSCVTPTIISVSRKY